MEPHLLLQIAGILIPTLVGLGIQTVYLVRWITRIESGMEALREQLARMQSTGGGYVTHAVLDVLVEKANGEHKAIGRSIDQEREARSGQVQNLQRELGGRLSRIEEDMRQIRNKVLADI